MSVFGNEREEVWDDFIAYCGDDMQAGSPTRQFAYKLYEKLSGCNRRVYFAPMVGQGDAYRSEERLKGLLGGLKGSVIVLLSPHFFDRFGKAGKNRSEESPLQKELRIALETARERAVQSGSHATRKSYLKYVHTEGFRWCAMHENWLSVLFPGYAFDEYFDVSAYEFPEGGGKAAEAGKALSGAAQTPAGGEVDRAVEKFIKTHLGIDVNREQSLKEYGEEVELCFHSMYAHGRYFFLDEFHFACDTEKNPAVRSALKHNYDAYCSVLKTYGLHTECAAYWPVFFTDLNAVSGDAVAEIRKIQNDSIFPRNGSSAGKIPFSTCAICFGALQLMNWLSEDAKRYGGSNRETPAKTNGLIMECLRGALGFIVFMCGGEGAWPEQKYLTGDDEKGADKGLNQTTLSISTLLKSGFLTKQSEFWGTADDDVLEKRFAFLCKSVKWLLEVRTESEFMCYWNIGGEQKGSVLMTAMCMETLIKFLQDEYVREHAGSLKKTIGACDFGELFGKIVGFFRFVQEESGGLFPSVDCKVPSFSHTAKGMNALLAFYRYAGGGAAAREAGAIAGKCFSYLYGLIADPESRLYHGDRQKDYEIFNLTGSQDYELSGELMTVTAAINFLCLTAGERAEILQDDPVADPIQRNSFVTMLFDLLDGYRRRHLKCYFDATAAESVLLKGRREREDEQYPVYMLYYYRMAISRLLELARGEVSASPETGRAAALCTEQGRAEGAA